MTYSQARLGIHDALRSRRTPRELRAIRRKYRLYDLRHPVRWYARLWCALVVTWWTAKEMIHIG